MDVVALGELLIDFTENGMRFERSESMQVDFEEIRKCIRRWRSYIILRMATVISPSIGIRVQI